MADPGGSRWWRRVLLSAGVALLLLPASQAQATNPGINGPILIDDPGWDSVPGLTAVDPETGAATRIADYAAGYTSVSADGRTVAYTQKHLPTAPDFIPSTSIFLSNMDGTNHREVANRPFSPVVEMALSPDASTIAYWAERDSFGIHAISTTGGEPVQLTSVLNDSRPDYSPDGTKLVFNRYDGVNKCGAPDLDVWVVNADGSGAHPVADDPNHQEVDPRFTPDGRVTYWRIHGRVPCQGSKPLPSAVHSVTVNGRADHPITPVDLKEKGLAIPSPDGRQLLMIRGFKLVTMALKGKNKGKTEVVPGPRGFPLAWAPAPR